MIGGEETQETPVGINQEQSSDIPVETPVEQKESTNTQEDRALTDLKTFLQMQNIQYNQLPEEIRNQAEHLIAQEGTPEQVKELQQLLHSIPEKINKLDPEQGRKLQKINDSVQNGDIPQDQVFDAVESEINGISNTDASQEDIDSALQGLSQLKEQAEIEESKRSPDTIISGFEKFAKIFKYLCAAVLAILGFGLFKGIAAKQQGGGI